MLHHGDIEALGSSVRCFTSPGHRCRQAQTVRTLVGAAAPSSSPLPRGLLPCQGATTANTTVEKPMAGPNVPLTS